MIKSAEIQRPYPLGHGGRLFYYDLSEHHELIVILSSIKQNSNIRNILKKLVFFFILVSMFNSDENGLYMFKSNDKIYTNN